MARFIDRAIDNATDEEANAVVIELDTPGGLSSSMDDIVKDILSADVPIIVYVSPPGGSAASAGTFITLAGHVAAMAPATSIGAATPIGAGGEDLDDTLANKAINDAAERIRDIAILRGRNADWAESAVREAASLGATEAADLNVVDLVAPTLPALLEAVDGRELQLGSGQSVALRTAVAPLVRVERSLSERFLDIIADPNIAFLLLSLGALALLYELASPGAIFPGVFGVIALILGFFALSVVPFNWAGAALILVAFTLFFLELFIASHGLLALGGIVSLLLGGILLTSGNPPEFQVNRWLIYGVAAAAGAYSLFVVMSIVRARRLAPATGVQTLVGQHARTRSSLNPDGMVLVEGELWRATSEGGPISEGEEVVIVAVDGLKLRVRKAERS
jgi:membrane-bound serine protease (ClpP class)